MGSGHNDNELELATASSSAERTDGAVRQDGRKRRKAWTAVFAISLVVLVCSLAALGVIWFSYFQGQQKYHALEDYAQVDKADDGPAALTADWESLMVMNSETVAWLFMPNTVINYPVVRGGDNDYYLTHDFGGEEGWLASYGAIFMDCRNNPDWSDELYFIYGHHMNDGSMFADLAGMTDQGRFDECRTIYLLSPNGNFKLRTFALVRCPATEAIVQASFGSAEDRASYVQDKIDRSLVQVDDIPPIDAMGKLFAFGTCDNVADGRYVLYAYTEATTVEGLHGEVGPESELWIE